MMKVVTEWPRAGGGLYIAASKRPLTAKEIRRACLS